MLVNRETTTNNRNSHFLSFSLFLSFSVPRGLVWCGPCPFVRLLPSNLPEAEDSPFEEWSFCLRFSSSEWWLESELVPFEIVSRHLLFVSRHLIDSIWSLLSEFETNLHFSPLSTISIKHVSFFSSSFFFLFIFFFSLYACIQLVGFFVFYIFYIFFFGMWW